MAERLGPAVTRLRTSGGKLYAVANAFDLANPWIIERWYLLEETVKMFTDCGLSVQGDIDEPLTLDRDTGAYHGVKYYYHRKTGGPPDEFKRREVKPPAMPDGAKVKWHQGAWCKLVAGRYEPIEKARVAL